MLPRLHQTLALLIAVLLGVTTSWQGGLASPVPASPPPMVCKCCGGRHGKCATPTCCAKPADNHAPFAPASLPTSSQNEWHALAASTTSGLTLPLPVADCLTAGVTQSVSFTALPIFQRDCRYLL